MGDGSFDQRCPPRAGVTLGVSTALAGR